MFILAIHPVMWLIRSWMNPEYNSQGGWIFLCALSFFLWSVSSPIVQTKKTSKQFSFILLCFTALIRFIGQILSINTIGTIALSIDIYAIALLLRLDQRKRAFSPLWLSFLFLLSLPLERIIQRVSGYMLQLVSANISQHILGLLYTSVEQSGAYLFINGNEILVDLPCSGARGLIFTLFLYGIVMGFLRPSFLYGVLGFAVVLFSSLLSNTTRISLLSIGYINPSIFFGFDVATSPLHDMIGLLSLAIGMSILFLWCYIMPVTCYPSCFTNNIIIPPYLFNQQRVRYTSAAFLILCVGIINAPEKPVDISSQHMNINAPYHIQGYVGIPQPITAQEKHYYNKYGGSATKTSYGDNSLMILQTTAPLRHLHEPNICLQASGFNVKYAGRRTYAIPSSVYYIKSKTNEEWRIAASYISNQGHVVTNISEVVWYWMQNPGSTWSALHRISPLDEPEETFIQWDIELMTALDITTQNQKTV